MANALLDAPARRVIALVGIAFADTSFVPMPPDSLLLARALWRANRVELQGQ